MDGISDEMALSEGRCWPNTKVVTEKIVMINKENLDAHC